MKNMYLILFIILSITQSIEIQTKVDGTQLSNQFNNVVTCDQMSGIDFVQLDFNNPSLSLQFDTSKPHYAIEIYADHYYIGNRSDKFIELYIEDMLVDSKSLSVYSTNDQANFCFQNQNTLYHIYGNKFQHYSPVVNIKFKISTSYQDFKVGIRNVQIVQRLCDPTCATCGGPTMNDCKSCYSNAILYRANHTCVCKAGYNYFDLTINQCVPKCDKKKSLNDQNQCQDDQKLSSLKESFWNENSLDGWSAIENGLVVSNLQGKITQKNGIFLFGLFASNAIITQQLTNTKSIYIRIRFDLYTFASTETPKFQLTLDKIKTYIQPKHVYPCTGTDKCSIYHFDHYIDTDVNSKFSIQLQAQTDVRWGIREFIIDSVLCSGYCSECASKTVCKTCQSPYYLYQGTCVVKCPNTTSSNQLRQCFEYSEYDQSVYPNQYGQYIDKAFFDDYVPNFITQSQFSLLSNYRSKFGTYYNQNRYYGGLNSAYMEKKYTDLPPHYQIRYALQLIAFKAGKSNGYGNVSVDSILTKYDFVNTSEYIEKVNVQKTQVHTSSTLTISIWGFGEALERYEVSVGLNQFYIVADLCYPLCRRCTGPKQTDCLDWILEQNSNLTTKTCDDGFKFNIVTQKCEMCPIGCKQCSDYSTCLTCESTFTQQGSGCYCMSGQLNEDTLECITNDSRRRLLTIEDRMKQLFKI